MRKTTAAAIVNARDSAHKNAVSVSGASLRGYVF